MKNCSHHRVCLIYYDERFQLIAAVFYAYFFVFWSKYLLLYFTSGGLVRKCEKEKLKLECRRGLEIKVKSANFGRLLPGDDVCPGKNSATTNCDNSAKSLAIVSKK